MVRQIILAGFVVILPAGVQAQRHGMMPPVSRPVAAVPRVVQAPRAGSAAVTPGPRPVMRGRPVRPRTAAPGVRSARQQGTTQRRFDDQNFRRRPGCNSAPGLGFDAVHQAAVCGSGTEGFRDRGFGSSFFFPFFDGGFSVPDSEGAVDEGSTAEQQPQPEAADAEVRDRGRRNRAAEPVTAPPVETPSSAPADDEQFVFVRRDGTVFFAVAYSWEKGTLRYITSQGLRRTVTQDALDLDATRKFNEQRGLDFRSPA